MITARGVSLGVNTDLLKDLCSIPAISGKEDTMISYMKDKFQTSDSVDEVSIDNLGNVIAHLSASNKQPETPKIAVFAHMDEIGVMVSKIEEKGFLRVEKVGSLNRKTVVGEQVLVETTNGMIPGIVGVSSYHFQDVEDRYKVPPIESVYIDIGTSSKDDALKRGVNIGSMITYRPNFTVLGSDFVTSKSLDNRLGCYTLIQLARELSEKQLNSNICLIASVQEEFNLQGITPAMKISPDIALCLDVYPACDTPDLEDKLDIKLGAGPVLTLLDFHGRGTIAGMVTNPKLIDFLEKTAKYAQVPTQRAAKGGILTDASYAQFQGEGIIIGTISVPVRYTHSPVETAAIADIDAEVTLLKEILLTLNSETLVKLKRG